MSKRDYQCTEDGICQETCQHWRQATRSGLPDVNGRCLLSTGVLSPGDICHPWGVDTRKAYNLRGTAKPPGARSEYIHICRWDEVRFSTETNELLAEGWDFMEPPSHKPDGNKVFHSGSFIRPVSDE